MTGEADGVVIGNRCLEVFCIPYAYMIGMWMALPAAEFIGGKMVYTLQVFLFNLFKLVMCIILIIAMTIKAAPVFFESWFQGMWEIFIFRGMAVQTGKAFMIPFVIVLPLNYIVRAHMPVQYPSI